VESFYCSQKWHRIVENFPYFFSFNKNKKADYIIIKKKKKKKKLITFNIKIRKEFTKFSQNKNLSTIEKIKNKKLNSILSVIKCYLN